MRRTKYARQIDSSAIAVFLTEREDKAHWIAVGARLPAFCAGRLRLGIKHAFINQSVGGSPEAGARNPGGQAGTQPDIVMRFRIWAGDAVLAQAIGEEVLA